MSDTFTSELIREMETELTQDEIEDEYEDIAFSNVNFEMINGFKVGSKLIWDRDEKQLYYKNSISKKKQGVGYTCRVEGCTARVFFKSDNTVVRDVGSMHLRTHSDQYHTCKQMWCENKMKERARTAPMSMTPFEIYLEAVNE